MIGKTLDHYKIIEKIGAGGMGEVYLAEDTRLGRKVALKFLAPELARHREAWVRFRNEARAAAELSHPNIATIHDFGEVDGKPFLVLEYLEGQTLRERIEQGPLPIDDVLRIGRAVAAGLAEAHAQGIVHRDIKSANLMLTSKGEVKILDFGLARRADATRMTREGTTLGTLNYMSPEQLRDDSVDERTDIWSLGVVLYESLTGKHPFTGENREAVGYRIELSDPAPPSSLRTGIPRRLEACILRCLEKDPATRLQSAEELLASLRAAESSGAIRGMNRAAGRRRGRAGRWLVVAAGLVVVAGAFTASWLNRLGQDQVSPKRTMIAVLPFENLSSAEDDYFARGITDAITARLAGIQGLAVISRQSAIQYRGSAKSLREIGEELGVTYVLEGTVQRERPGDSSSRVRIIPQLIRVADDTHVWANTYDEHMTEVFRLQSEVAERVAAALDVSILQSERRDLEAPPTHDLAAYEYVLQGNSYLDRKNSESNVRAAIRMYELAVAEDPEYVGAWAGLARAHTWLYWAWNRAEALPEARKAGDAARRLDPDSPETRLATGYLRYYGDQDFERALQDFEAVQTRRPSDAEAARGAALVLRRLGRWEEALQAFARADMLSPQSGAIESAWANTLSFLRRYDEAEVLFARALSSSPSDAHIAAKKAHFHLTARGDVDRASEVMSDLADRLHPMEIAAWLEFLPSVARILYHADRPFLDLDQIDPRGLDVHNAAVYWSVRADLSTWNDDEGMARAFWDSARTRLESVAQQEIGSIYGPYLRNQLGVAYAGLGRKEDALRLVDGGTDAVSLDRDAIAAPEQLLRMAEVYTRAGEVDAALAQLEFLMTIPSGLSEHLLRLDPIWDPLRDHPRFRELIGGD